MICNNPLVSIFGNKVVYIFTRIHKSHISQRLGTVYKEFTANVHLTKSLCATGSINVLNIVCTCINMKSTYNINVCMCLVMFAYSMVCPE